jgi:hypothetical protein
VAEPTYARETPAVPSPAKHWTARFPATLVVDWARPARELECRPMRAPRSAGGARPAHAGAVGADDWNGRKPVEPSAEAALRGHASADVRSVSAVDGILAQQTCRDRPGMRSHVASGTRRAGTRWAARPAETSNLARGEGRNEAIQPAGSDDRPPRRRSGIRRAQQMALENGPWLIRRIAPCGWHCSLVRACSVAREGQPVRARQRGRSQAARRTLLERSLAQGRAAFRVTPEARRARCRKATHRSRWRE